MNIKKNAEALLWAFNSKTKDEFEIFFNNFIEVIKQKKQEVFLPKIYKEIKKQIKEKKKKEKTILILKNKDQYLEYKNKLETLRKYFNLDNLNIIEDKKIIGGFILKNGFYIIDHSFRTRLYKLYKGLLRK